MGANTVNWTPGDAYLGVSESDSKLNTDFEFCEEKFIDISKNIDLHSQAIYWSTMPKNMTNILSVQEIVFQHPKDIIVGFKIY